MLSRKNSLLCRLATAMAPGSPKSASTVNSAVYTTWSPLAPLFWHQSLMDTRPLCIGFLVPGKINPLTAICYLPRTMRSKRS
uniref:Uncharacterized protein n=1 Tax=Oryza meridionalis TaxID=40149 RepID=A0A0E0CW59_9ORYZ